MQILCSFDVKFMFILFMVVLKWLYIWLPTALYEQGNYDLV